MSQYRDMVRTLFDKLPGIDRERIRENYAFGSIDAVDASILPMIAEDARRRLSDINSKGELWRAMSADKSGRFYNYR